METGVSENGVKYTVIRENYSPDLLKLQEIYNLDRQKAKIIFEHRKGSVNFYRTRYVLFEYPNGDFRFANLERKYGISKTNVMYSRESCYGAYGMKNGKLYSIQGNRPCILTVNNIWYGITGDDLEEKSNTFEGQYILGRFGWLRNLIEDERCHGINLNHVVSYKLYNVKACLRHLYKVPYPVAQMLSQNHGSYSPWDFMKVWKEMKKNLINIENLKAELFRDPLFKDTTLMANSLGRKVNCSWSKKRLKVEHDKMAREILDVILEFEELRNLKIRPVYQKFAEYSGYQMFTTNHQLIEEGKMMHHCVGTYSGQVDAGRSAIYRVFDHTLELNFETDWSDTPKEGKERRKILSIGQYMGYDNVAAPVELRKQVKYMVDMFNLEHGDEVNEEDGFYVELKDSSYEVNDPLPF